MIVASQEVITQLEQLDRINNLKFTMKLIIIFDDKVSEKIAIQIEREINNEHNSFLIEGLEITPIKDFKNFENLLKQDGFTPFFLIDICHGESNDLLGLSTIEQLRQKYPDSFIAAYSSGDYQKEAKEAGSDIFYIKSGKSWDDTLKELKSEILEYFCIDPFFNHKDTIVSEFYGRILEVNEDKGTVLLHLEKKDDRSIVNEYFFKINRLKKVGDLYIDKNVLMCKYEYIDESGGTYTKIEFREGEDGFFEEPHIDWEKLENYESLTHQ
jgi:hypothetical protein